MMKVLALAGRAHIKSFGMIPIIVDAGLADDYICLGLSSESEHREVVSKKEFSALLKGGHMTDIAHLNLSLLLIELNMPGPTRLTAGWLGDTFYAQASFIGIPVPNLPENRSHIKGLGSLWLENSKIFYNRMESWVKLAAMRVFKEKNAILAELMQWTLPSAPETLAAVWYLKDTKEKKDNEIDFQLRTFYRGKSRRAIIARHNTLIFSYL